jgi:putative tricarboxylic transport membrane protein
MEKTAPAWGDVLVGVGVLAIAGIVGWQTSVIPTSPIYARVGPTFFPWLVTAMLGVLGAILLVQGFRGGWEKEEQAGFDLSGGAWCVAGLALNLALIETAGFIIASTVMFLCVARAFGSARPLRDAGIGFALAFVAYVGFDRLLGYRIGSGLIEQLF